MLRFGTGLALAAALLLGGASNRVEAAIIIDGTDASDHGNASGGANVGGWEYMQRAIQNLAASNSPSVAKVLVDIGTTSGSQARNAINSAFNLSGLGGLGWSILHIDSAAAITSYLSTMTTGNTGILCLPTYGLTSGDMDSAEMAAVNAGASLIDGYTFAGGSLFAMGQVGTGAYGWLSTLLPGVTTLSHGTGGRSENVTLTPEGFAAFPGLTNADLAGADPWHVEFGGTLGNLDILGISNVSGTNRNVILGASSGSVTQPVPEPASIVSLGIAGLIGAGAALRRRYRNRAAN